MVKDKLTDSRLNNNEDLNNSYQQLVNMVKANNELVEMLKKIVTKFGMLVELLVQLLLPAVDAVVFVSVVTASVGVEINSAVVTVFMTKLWMLVKLLVLLLLSAVDFG